MEHQNEIIQLKAEMKAKDKRIESFSLTDQANSIYTRKATFDKS